jgi:hypothetical protein
MAGSSAALASKRTAQAPKAQVFVRNINILVHGVNTDAAWFSLVEQALWGMSMYAVVPFTWGDYENKKQGGYPNYAADEVIQLFENPTFGYDRIYQGHSAVRLKELIDECRKLKVQVNVIAHSNGTLLTAGALLLGATLDNFIIMGSPLDCDNTRSQNELAKATKNVSGKVINFWSPQDEWAHLKGGIGAFGNNSTYTSKNPRIQNVKFSPGSTIKGVKIIATGQDVIAPGYGQKPIVLPNFGHSDYMLKAHMPIFSSYIKEFGQGSVGGQVDSEQLKKLRQQGDWTQVSYYKTKKNVTLSSPEMKKYKAKIDEIRK